MPNFETNLFSVKKINPPEFTKTLEDCPLRAGDGECCNALNYLRPHKCNKYCVVKVDSWLREEHPHLSEEEKIALVTKFTHHKAE